MFNNIESLRFVSSELMLLGMSLILLFLSTFKVPQKFFWLLAYLSVSASAFLLPTDIYEPQQLFFGLLIHDQLSIVFRFLILSITAVVILLSFKSGEEGSDRGEYFYFLLTAALSMLLAVSTNNLLMIYLTLEAVSILSYLLAGYNKRDMFSSESGMKYFIFGAFSTGVTLYGISLAYGLFGTLDITAMNVHAISPFALIVVSLLILVGFGFKCSLVPFHMWTPDVYQGAPTAVAAFLSVAPKAMGFVFILRIFLSQFKPLADPLWALLAGFIALITMTIGNLTALKQENIKRLLAYSTIAQAGYIFLGFSIGTKEGITSSLFYIVIYTVMNLGAFAGVIALLNSSKGEKISDLSGLYKKSPLASVALAVSLLSLAGIPPFAGFLAKFFILKALISASDLSFALVMVLNSVVAMYYYLNVLKTIFLTEGVSSDAPAVNSPAIFLVLVLSVIGNLFLGLYPQVILNWLSGVSF